MIEEIMEEMWDFVESNKSQLEDGCFDFLSETVGKQMLQAAYNELTVEINTTLSSDYVNCSIMSYRLKKAYNAAVWVRENFINAVGEVMRWEPDDLDLEALNTTHILMTAVWGLENDVEDCHPTCQAASKYAEVAQICAAAALTFAASKVFNMGARSFDAQIPIRDPFFLDNPVKP